MSSCRKADKVSANSQQPAIHSSAPTTLSAAAGTGDCLFLFHENSLLANGWTKVFEDEFSTDLSKWNVWTGGAYNNEWQHYQGANLTWQDGILSITAKKENVVGKTLPTDPATKAFQYTSGRIESKTHFSASNSTPKVRMMARIRLPSGNGLWPAFWSYGDPWPTQGEIDIMEARGNEPFVYHTAYWYGRRSGLNQASGTEASISTTASLMDCWHVYEVIWEKNKLTFYLDGQIVNTKQNGEIPNFFRKSQRVVLNLAVGGNFFNPAPATIEPGVMQIDWVKVFTSK